MVAMRLSFWLEKIGGYQADPARGSFLHERLGPGFLFGCSLEISVQFGKPRDFSWNETPGTPAAQHGRGADPWGCLAWLAQHTKGQMAARGQPCTLSGEAERPAWGDPHVH